MDHRIQSTRPDLVSINKKSKLVKVATLVEGDPKAPFSGGVGGATLFLRLLQFTLDTYLIMLSVKQGGIKYYFFESLVSLDWRLNPGLLDH